MDITYYYQQIINQSILNNKFRDVNTIIRSLDYLRIRNLVLYLKRLFILYLDYKQNF